MGWDREMLRYALDLGRPRSVACCDLILVSLYKSMSPEIMKDRLQYAQDTGIRTIDMWGLEWWYFMKQNHNQPEIWNIIKSQIAETSQQ